jgi:phthalate 4,5-dioxygenase oxygenase subunit
MRRHWLPALLTEELPGPDGDPVRVAARRRPHRVSHRTPDWIENSARTGTPRCSTAATKNAWPRCLYHGWKVDVQGNVVEMSSSRRKPIAAKVKPNLSPHEAAGSSDLYEAGGGHAALEAPSLGLRPIPRSASARSW